MAGRGGKGLLIMIGSCAQDAQAEASRDGAPPVELIDGNLLCDLLREYGLGIEEDITANSAFSNKYEQKSDYYSIT